MKILLLILSLSLCAGICQAQFLPGPTSPLKISDKPVGNSKPMESKIVNLGRVTLENLEMTTEGAIALSWFADTVGIPKPIYDTIPVILLVCDTVQYSAIGLGCTHREPAAFWLRGYKVNLWVKKHDYWNMVIDEKGRQITGSWQHFSYLDSSKKRLNYLVWDAREVKK